ncbi:MAG: hypothetical protein U9N46_00045 [Euryarchaeota archaeon]|nr:hypothetical protein [Euryarchaeota archaeon]
MQQMMLTVRPTSDFEVPSSTGYQLYSALLAVMRSSNPEASGRVHDSEIGAIAISGLSGTFGRATKRPMNKILHSRQTYRFHIGITDPSEIEIFQSLIQPLMLEGLENPTGIALNFQDSPTPHWHGLKRIKFTLQLYGTQNTCTHVHPQHTGKQ